MEWFNFLLDFVIHLDTHLGAIIDTYGVWTYSILFVIVFCETGLVVTPFLPGDTLLFAAGSFAALGNLNLALLCLILSIAAFLGDTVNYWIGHALSTRLLEKKKLPLIKMEHLERTQKFFDKYGGKTIIIARFVPIVRTFAPFVAGIGKMHYGKFISYNVIGGLAWVLIFLLGGYFFGNLSFVRENFSLVLLAIIVISMLPVGIEYLRAQRPKSQINPKSQAPTA